MQQSPLRLLEFVSEPSRGFFFDFVGPSNRRLGTRQLRGRSRLLVRQRRDALGGRLGGGVGVSRALFELPVPRPELLLFRLEASDGVGGSRLGRLDRLRERPRVVLSRRVDARQLVPKRSNFVREAFDRHPRVGEVRGGGWEIPRQVVELGFRPFEL